MPNTGYQTQFNYRLNDGSFGTFQDSKSSIWLTASVVKAFALARKYIYVTESGLQQSVNWLVKQQLSDGCFPIIGSLVHKDMKSETDDSLTTVFVLISLLESKLEVPTATIKNAMNCIERSKLNYYNILYTKIMTTYALTLMEHPLAKAAVQEMLRVAKNENDVMWWEDPERKSLSSSIEMTSYMVLAMAQLGGQNMKDALMAVRWLTRHKNSLGGFVSTHDSALASQAITAYAVFGGRPTTQLSVLVITDDLDRPCKLDEETSLIPEYVDLPKTPSSVDVSVHGDGCAVAQVNVKYSILPRPSQSFDLSVTVNPIVPDKCDILELQACTRYKGSDGYTNMAILEVSMLTGYVPVRDSLDQLLTSRKIQKYEIKENKLHLYFEKLIKEVTCVSLKIRKQIEVYNFKPSNVKVYDYYRPELNAMATYTINRGCNNTELLDKYVKLSIYMLVEDILGTVATYNGKIKDSERT
nr:PREDICTED: alpha-2-macroglobulin-like [Megachile rotundata]